MSELSSLSSHEQGLLMEWGHKDYGELVELSEDKD